MKYLPLLGLALLCGCAAPGTQWGYSDSGKCRPEHASRMIFLPGDSQFRGLEVQIIKTQSGVRGYLSIRSLSLPEEKGSPGKTAVEIEVEDIASTFLADRLEGGQRMLLPPEALKLIISSLEAGKSVNVSVGRYYTAITPDGFSQVHKNFHED